MIKSNIDILPSVFIEINNKIYLILEGYSQYSQGSVKQCILKRNYRISHSFKRCNLEIRNNCGTVNKKFMMIVTLSYIIISVNKISYYHSVNKMLREEYRIPLFKAFLLNSTVWNWLRSCREFFFGKQLVWWYLLTEMENLEIRLKLIMYLGY